MKKIKNLLVIQARMGSERFPGKVLLKLGRITVLEWVIRASKKIRDIDDIIVATTSLKKDRLIEKLCINKGVKVFKGQNKDVLSRIYEAVKKKNPQNVIRITADCPFLDPEVCNQVLFLHEITKADYTSNTIPRTWPDGLDCEVLKFGALKKANYNATLPSDREHVTKWVKNNQNIFNIQSLICPFKNFYKFRLTIDFKNDYRLMKKIVKNFSDKEPIPYLRIVNYLKKNPRVQEINKKIKKTQINNVNKDIKSRAFTKKKFLNSKKLFDETKKIISLGSQTFSKSYINWPTGSSPLFLTHGQGGRVWDVDGNEYVDLVCGLLPVILGYCDQDIDYAIREQLNRGISFSLATSLEVKLGKKLNKLIPSAEQARFSKNGSDTTTAAIRLARFFTKRDRIVVCGYHGWHDWFISSTSMNKGIPNQVNELTHTIKYNSLIDLEKIFSKYPDQIAAVIMEPANYEKPKEFYLKEAKKIIKKNKALLIFDEICTGFRFSLGGAQSYFNVIPDLSCFGKSMGNGMPIAALVGKKKYMQHIDKIFFSGTFGGETLSLIAALAVIEKMEKDFVINYLWKYGNNLKLQVNKLLKKYKLNNFIQLKGYDPWILLSFLNYKNYTKFQIMTLFKSLMIKNGVLISNSHNICFAHNNANLKTILNAYKMSFSEISEILRKGNLVRSLKSSRIITPVFQVREQLQKK